MIIKNKFRFLSYQNCERECLFYILHNQETPNKPHGKEVVCQIFTQAYLNEQKNPFDFDVAPWNLCTHVISVDKTSRKTKTKI